MNRILLQCFDTGRYLDAAGDWTDRPELARDFPNCLQATEFKLRRRLSQAFVVVVPASPDHAEPAPGCEGVAASRQPGRWTQAGGHARSGRNREAKRII